MKRNKNKKGFTIVELVIVIGVIGILSAILIPTFVNLTDKANKAALKSNLANAYSMYAADAADGTYEVLDNEGKPTGETYTIDFKAQEDVILSDGAATGTKYYTYKSHSTDAPVEWAEDIDIDWAKRSEADALRRKENSQTQEEMKYAELKLQRALNRLRVSSMHNE